MSTPEQKIKQKIQRRMEKLAMEAGLPFFWDTPPASEFGVSGRPDHTCRIGMVMFHIEAKAASTGKRAQPTEKQADFHAQLLVHGEYTLVVAGQSGVDQLYHAVRDMIIAAYTVEKLEKRIHDARRVMLVADKLSKQPVRGQAQLDIAPGSGKSCPGALQ